MKQNDARKIETHLDCQPDDEASPSAANNRESWEKEQYACYYNYLFSLIKGERLDYAKVAKRSGLKERRIEEVLTFRLKPARRNTQLFGYREGACYVCNVKTHTSGPVEPVCLKCLQMIEVACLEIEEDAALLAQTSTPEPSQTGDAPALSLEAQPVDEKSLHPSEVQSVITMGEEKSATEAMVPAKLLLDSQAELQRYKKHFGELPLEVPVESQHMTSVSLEAPAPKENLAQAADASEESRSEVSDSALKAVEQPAEDPNETEGLLKILSVNDQELASEAAELTDLLKTILPDNNAPLRHFGFLRSKAYKVQ